MVDTRGDALAIESVGRLRMAVNGAAASDAVVGAGDVIELGGQLVLLVARGALQPAPVHRGAQAASTCWGSLPGRGRSTKQ